MQEIKAYKASDGKIFETADAASAYESELKFSGMVTKFVNEKYYSNISKQEIIEIIVDFCGSYELVDFTSAKNTVIQSTVKSIFGLLDAKTSWGRNELKTEITYLISGMVESEKDNQLPSEDDYKF